MTSQGAAPALGPMRQLDRKKVISFRAPSTSVHLLLSFSAIILTAARRATAGIPAGRSGIVLLVLQSLLSIVPLS